MKAAAAGDMAARMPFNKHKAAEHGAASQTPPEGQHVAPPSVSVTGSTLSEANPSPKTGSGKPRLGDNPTSQSLDRARVDDGGQGLTTNLTQTWACRSRTTRTRSRRDCAARR